MEVCLLLLDPQNDFLDKKGSSYNKEKTKSAKVFAKFIKENTNQITNINVTLQHNNLISPSFSYFWKNSAGKQPNVGEKITTSDIEERSWHPVKLTEECNPEELCYQLNLTGDTEITIQKNKCFLGSWGSLILSNLQNNISDWSTTKGTPIIPISRNAGNIFTKDICEYQLYLEQILRDFDVIINFGVITRFYNYNYRDVATMLKNKIENALINNKSVLIYENFSN